MEFKNVFKEYENSTGKNWNLDTQKKSISL